jgi:hypothetical protein
MEKKMTNAFSRCRSIPDEPMEKEISELRADVKTLLAMAERSKGSLWAGMMIVSALSSFVGFFSHYFTVK